MGTAKHKMPTSGEVRTVWAGREIEGKWTLKAGRITVMCEYGEDATQLGNLTVKFLAEDLLRSICRKANLGPSPAHIRAAAKVANAVAESLLKQREDQISREIRKREEDR